MSCFPSSAPHRLTLLSPPHIPTHTLLVSGLSHSREKLRRIPNSLPGLVQQQPHLLSQPVLVLAPPCSSPHPGSSQVDWLGLTLDGSRQRGMDPELSSWFLNPKWAVNGLVHGQGAGIRMEVRPGEIWDFILCLLHTHERTSV